MRVLVFGGALLSSLALALMIKQISVGALLFIQSIWSWERRDIHCGINYLITTDGSKAQIDRWPWQYHQLDCRWVGLFGLHLQRIGLTT